MMKKKNTGDDDDYHSMEALDDNEADLWPSPPWCCCLSLKSHDKQEEPPKDGCLYDADGHIKWNCLKTKKHSQIKAICEYL